MYRYDDAIPQMDMAKVGDYMRTLDIEKLGDLNHLAVRPSIITAKAMPSSLDYLVEGEYPTYYGSDFWSIFSRLVKDVTELDFTLTRTNEVINLEHRDDLSSRFVTDIARQIITVAENGRGSLFFTPPENWKVWAKGAVALHVTEVSQGVARSVAAKTSEQKQEASPTTTAPQQSEKSSE
jgi:hypothetical protein